jgi:hypothetical protein
MATQAVKQGLHLMGQLGNIRETEGGRSPFDRMCTTKYPVELFIVGRLQIQVEQHLLHQIEVFSGLFEENLIKLA